ncbi:MAG: AbrB/MazE/SpoVT family DNA-binding domain-containing protein [Methanophagales archaeon]|nr:AbrB/MazE/SpoVT family DNA-binding domain-containing protein [Methanophagales archaeon]
MTMIKVSMKGEIELPVEIRRKYGIEVGKEVEILDFGKEIVIVPVPKKRAKGFIKFKRPVSEIISDNREEEEEFERRRSEIRSR